MMYVKGHGMSYFDSLYCIKRFQFDKLMTQKILQLNMKVCPIDDGKPRCIHTTKIFFRQYFGVGMETSLLAFYTYCIDRPEYWLLNASIEAWKPHTSQDYECKIKNDVSGSGTCIYSVIFFYHWAHWQYQCRQPVGPSAKLSAMQQMCSVIQWFFTSRRLCLTLL